jgi:hypothetical protein
MMKLISCMMDFLPDVRKSIGELRLGTKSVVTIEGKFQRLCIDMTACQIPEALSKHLS